ncbi:MAG: histidine phosphatase family protein [Chloroflexi bacterium]|nr:histidine phosphatase family protein [Chloroflexota bacterium]
MRLYFIRHAQSENNHLWDSTGSSKGRSDDPRLTEIGVQQAEILAAHLRHAAGSGYAQTRDLQQIDDVRITHIYCSLMTRAMATATAIAKALHMPLVARDDLFEVGGIYLEDEETGENHGRPGGTRSYYSQHFPDCELPASVSEAGWWNRPYEHASERFPRAKRVLHDLLARHGDSDDRVAIVSHGAFFNYLLAAAVDLPDPTTSPTWFLLNNTSLTRFDFQDKQTGVVYMNRVDFLPRALVT